MYIVWRLAWTDWRLIFTNKEHAVLYNLWPESYNQVANLIIWVSFAFKTIFKIPYQSYELFVIVYINTTLGLLQPVSESGRFPPIQLFFKVVLILLGLSYLHGNFGISLTISTRKPERTLIWGKFDPLTILIFQIYDTVSLSMDLVLGSLSNGLLFFSIEIICIYCQICPLITSYLLKLLQAAFEKIFNLQLLSENTYTYSWFLYVDVLYTATNLHIHG